MRNSPGGMNNGESNMDNPRVRFWLDNPDDVVAGRWVTGRLSCTLTPKARLWWRGLELSLDGWEHDTVAGDGESRETQRILIRKTQSIASWDYHADCTRRPQTVEYPFRFHLPGDLPGTVLFRTTDDEGQYSVHYELTASLVATEQGTLVRSPVQQHPLRVLAQPWVRHGNYWSRKSRIMQANAVQVPKQTFPIMTRLFRPQGNLEVGYKLHTDVIMPGDKLQIGFFGMNNCHDNIGIKSFLVSLKEYVEWNVDNTSMRIESLLLKQKLVTPENCHLRSNRNPHSSEENMIWFTLQVPKDCVCHNTFNGSLLQVRHVIEIIAETSKSMTTNPRLTPQMIQLVNEPGFSGPVDRAAAANDDLADDIADLVMHAVIGAAVVGKAASTTVGLMQKHFGTTGARQDKQSQTGNDDKQNGCTRCAPPAANSSSSSCSVNETTAAYIPEHTTSSFCKNQRVWYFHKASGRRFEAIIVAVHLDDGVDCPYFTIRYARDEGEMVEKQTTSDRLAAVLPTSSSTTN